MLTRTSRHYLLTAAAAVLALVVTGCSSSSSSSSSRSSTSGSSSAASGAGGGDVPTMTTSYLPITGYAPLVVAEQEGIWAKHGIKVERVNVASPAIALSDVVAGKLSIGQVNVGATGTAILKKLPITIIAAGYWDYETQGLYVTKGSSITSLSQLAGKTVALGALNNNFQASVDYALDKAGVDPASVKFTLIPIGNTASTLKAGTVPVAQVAEPSITKEGDAIRPILTRPWDAVGVGQPHVVSYIVASNDYIKNNTKAVNDYVAAWNEAMTYSQAHPDVARQAVGKVTGLDKSITNKMKLPIWKTGLDLTGAQAQLNLMVKYHILDSAPSLAEHVLVAP